MKTKAQILTAAADLIEEKGWVQGHFDAADGAVCAVGAIRTVMFGSTRCPDTYTWLYEEVKDALLDEIGPNGVNGIPTWNDAFSRTKAEVVAAFRAAASTAHIDELRKALS